MSDHFSKAFDPPIPGTTGVNPVQSVQSSLYLRLKKSRGNKAGTIGWLLVRAGQPEHPRHAEALEALEGLDASGLAEVLAVARATVGALSGKPDALALARLILDELEGVAGGREGRAMAAAMSPADREQFSAAVKAKRAQ